MEAVVTSSAAACIRCVAVDPTGKRVAVSSECVAPLFTVSLSS